MGTRSIVVIGCSVMTELLGSRLPPGVPATWLDITLHNTPKKLAATLQQSIDDIAQPSLILIGYGQMETAEARELKPHVVFVDADNKVMATGYDPAETFGDASLTRGDAVAR